MGTPTAVISRRATGWLGMRTPTVLKPAVTSPDRAGFLVKTKVRGPGQKYSISFSSCGLILCATMASSSGWAM